MHMYHVKTGRTRPIPLDKNERQAMRAAGWMETATLVDTVNGHRVEISTERQVNSGLGVDHALGLKRTDAGNEGRHAFMQPEEWERLPKEERRKLVIGSLAAGRAPQQPDAAEIAAQAHRREVEEIARERDTLRKQIEELRAGVAR
jgi:hypothetical protein